MGKKVERWVCILGGQERREIFLIKLGSSGWKGRCVFFK